MGQEVQEGGHLTGKSTWRTVREARMMRNACSYW